MRYYADTHLCAQLWGEYICSGYRVTTSCGPPPSPTPTPSPSPKMPPPGMLKVLAPPPPPVCLTGSLTGGDSRTCAYALTDGQIPAVTGAALLVAIVIPGNDYPGLAFTSPITPSRCTAR